MNPHFRPTLASSTFRHSSCVSHGDDTFLASASAPLAVSLIAGYVGEGGVNLAIEPRIVVSLTTRSSPGSGPAVSEVLSRLPKAPCACGLNSLRCDSFTPIRSGVGLKTSSGYVTALTAALAFATGQTLSNKQTVDIALAVQKSLRLTVAGSIDDTWSAVEGGLVITSTASRRLIARLRPPDVRIVLLVPRGSEYWAHRADRISLLRPHTAQVRRLRKKLLEGDIWPAATEHAFLHARALRYPARPLHLALDAGALGVCLSGKGPAVAAFTTAKTEPDIVSTWRAEFPDALIFPTMPSAIGLTIHHNVSAKETWQCR